MKNKKKVAVDVDGVLLDMEAHWRSIAQEITNRDISRQNGTYDLKLAYDVSDDEYSKIWKRLDWRGFPALKGAKKAMEILSNNNYEIIIVTAITQAMKEDREYNLQQHGILFDQIETCSASKNKKIFYEKHSVFAVIDDVANVINMSVRSDIEHLFYVNRGYSDQGRISSLPHVHSVSGVLEAVNKLVQDFS